MADYAQQKLNKVEEEIKALEAEILTIEESLVDSPEDKKLEVQRKHKQGVLADLKEQRKEWMARLPIPPVHDIARTTERRKSEELQQQAGSPFLVSGRIKNALKTKGVRCRLYRLVDINLGYYDAYQLQALFYEGKDLMVHVLFKTEHDALKFESHLRSEKTTIGSSLNCMDIESSVERMEGAKLSKRIFFEDYQPEESESPQDAMSQILTETSFCEPTTDEFKYQRIESTHVFGSYGKAESAHIMSREHCRAYPSYLKYDNDKNNRLALSRELHGFYDSLNVYLPVINIRFVSASETPVIDGRYEVKVEVLVIEREYKNLVFPRLKEGSVQSDDNELAMITSVFVNSPSVFKFCLDWKFNEISKQWVNHLCIQPAVP